MICIYIRLMYDARIRLIATVFLYVLFKSKRFESTEALPHLLNTSKRVGCRLPSLADQLSFLELVAVTTGAHWEMFLVILRALDKSIVPANTLGCIHRTTLNEGNWTHVPRIRNYFACAAKEDVLVRTLNSSILYHGINLPTVVFKALTVWVTISLVHRATATTRIQAGTIILLCTERRARLESTSIPNNTVRLLLPFLEESVILSLAWAVIYSRVWVMIIWITCHCCYCSHYWNGEEEDIIDPIEACRNFFPNLMKAPRASLHDFAIPQVTELLLLLNDGLSPASNEAPKAIFNGSLGRLQSLVNVLWRLVSSKHSCRNVGTSSSKPTAGSVISMFTFGRNLKTSS